jgi:hypothetical protein
MGNDDTYYYLVISGWWWLEHEWIMTFQKQLGMSSSQLFPPFSSIWPVLNGMGSIQRLQRVSLKIENAILVC